MRRPTGRVAAGLVPAVLLLLTPLPGRCDTAVLDLWENGQVQPQTIFPNWAAFRTSSFEVLLCIGCGGVAENLKGLTVVNFGTAGPADLKAVYWEGECGATKTALIPLTFAGTYVADTGNYPAWTWAGTSIDFGTCAGVCGTCAGEFTVNLYADVAACPAALATVNLGFPYRSTGLLNALTDNYGFSVPWVDTASANHLIVHSFKEGDKDAAAPGDTVTYTIYYGRPGTAALAPITIMDTLPPYTHLLAGTPVPAADLGWDPNIGPPPALRWTVPGPLAVAGGPTGEVHYAVTVDWGNGELFEPGSGDIAPPEGARLDNRAQVIYEGSTCASTSAINPPVSTVVRRFRFWEVGDNDILYSATLGQPPDEMTYEVYLQNLSTTKTWWNVAVWDTVPAELDAWCAGCGLEDPCTGWTMTPSGCAAAAAGRLVQGAVTLMTWKLDMPPGLTLTLRWKSQVRAADTAGATVVNSVSLLENGRTGIAGGTGSSGTAASFVHLAPVVLPTVYLSYVGFAGTDTSAAGCGGFFLDFFPLNKKTQFELRGLEYQGAGWALVGGTSASIGTLLGDCLGGFPGGGTIPGGGQPGCKVERTPATYFPTAWTTVCPVFPFHFVYKVTANSPLLWQLMTVVLDDNWDQSTFAPSTAMSYLGFTMYTWRRRDNLVATANYGESLSLINTGVDAGGVYQPAKPTTVHLFRFDYGTLTWQYMRTFNLDGESQAYDMGTPAAEEGPWRILSSDTRLMINQQIEAANSLPCCCANCADQWATAFPNTGNGNLVSPPPPGTGTFYGLVQGGLADPTKVVIGNTGAVDATYRIWRYVPANLIAKAPMPPNLNGTSGYWIAEGTHTVPQGFANAGNPRIYDQYATSFDANGMALHKVEVLSGGPVQMYGGVRTFGKYEAGSLIHDELGGQTGTAFWLNYVEVNNTKSYAGCTATVAGNSTMVVEIFCPKTGTAVRAVSESGYTATYTTTAPDECVAFLSISDLAAQAKLNYRFSVLGASPGKVVAMYEQCIYGPKVYTAPFVQSGVHYTIIAPAVAFAGQSFWITVVVVDVGGGTKTDYCGTTSFTGTDPAGRIEATGMDTYNYTWDSNDVAASCVGAGCVNGCDNGVKIFLNVSLSRLGFQTIVAVDTVDGSITGLAALQVVGADVKLSKQPSLVIAASGDTVRFRVCWSNYSSASAFSFVITDAVPQGTAFVPEAGTAAFDCGNTGGATVDVAASTATSATVPPPGSFAAGNPPSTARWLRWTVNVAGVNTTGCVCYRVSVN